MQFLTRKQVAKKIGYHPVHISRLVKEGWFVKPVRLSANRLAFVESEVHEWMSARVEERDAELADATDDDPG